MDVISTPDCETGKLRLEVSRLQEHLAKAKRQIIRLEQTADIDPVVPVLNRRAFERALSRTIAHCRRYEATACLVYCDLDDFRQINDRHGHAAGDAVLRHVGALFVEHLRKSDIIGRPGGDEFAAIVMHCDMANGPPIADRLEEVLAQHPTVCNGVTIPVSGTCAVIQIKRSSDATAALNAAEQAIFGLRDRSSCGKPMSDQPENHAEGDRLA